MAFQASIFYYDRLVSVKLIGRNCFLSVVEVNLVILNRLQSSNYIIHKYIMYKYNVNGCKYCKLKGFVKCK